MEFLESHTGKNMKAVWRNDIGVSENASDESDGNDDDSEDNEDKGENENKEEEDQEEEKEKIADKVMTDLEVCCYLYIIIEYDINYSD